MRHRRSPCVQHAGEADAGAEMPGIGRDGGERLGRGPEQQAVDLGLVLVGDRRDRRRQGEDEMVVGHGQEIGLPVREPILRRCALAARAVPVAAGVVGDGRVIAVVTAHDMAAERSRAAGPDRTHHLELAAAEPMAREISLAMPVQDVRDLQCRPRHDRRRTAMAVEAAPAGRAGSSPRARSSARRGCRRRWCRASGARAGPG